MFIYIYLILLYKIIIKIKFFYLIIRAEAMKIADERSKEKVESRNELE